MDADTFVDRTQRLLDARTREDAADAVHATLRTLGEQLSPEEADDLAAQLPDGIHDHLRSDANGNPKDTDIEAFYAQVARRQSPQAQTDYAREQVRAVFTVLSEAVNAEELRAATAQLSKDYRELLAPGSNR